MRSSLYKTLPASIINGHHIAYAESAKGGAKNVIDNEGSARQHFLNENHSMAVVSGPAARKNQCATSSSSENACGMPANLQISMAITNAHGHMYACIHEGAA